MLDGSFECGDPSAMAVSPLLHQCCAWTFLPILAMLKKIGTEEYSHSPNVALAMKRGELASPRVS